MLLPTDLVADLSAGRRNRSLLGQARIEIRLPLAEVVHAIVVRVDAVYQDLHASDVPGNAPW